MAASPRADRLIMQNDEMSVTLWGIMKSKIFFFFKTDLYKQMIDFQQRVYYKVDYKIIIKIVTT